MCRAALLGWLIGYSFSQLLIDFIEHQSLTPTITLATLVAILYYVSKPQEIKL